MFGMSTAKLIEMFKSKVTVEDALDFIEKHASKVDGVVKLIIQKHYDRTKRIFSKLSPETRQSFILLLQDSEKKTATPPQG